MHWHRYLICAGLAASSGGWSGCAINATANENTTQQRPPNWAQAVKMDGVPNLFKVSDYLYRSAQPSAIGMQNLKEAGIETVVNLRSFHSDRDEIGDTGLGYEHIYMKAWHPEEKEIVRFLQIVTNPKRTPVIVHCQHGADRTGIMCAAYRVVVQGWSKEEALKEMTEGGYGFHPIFQNLSTWFDELDVDRIRERAKLPATLPAPSEG
jgi:protein tyrosine phosphatase (PTP) superfamily phosphohydrolase (DUF442 family)